MALKEFLNKVFDLDAASEQLIVSVFGFFVTMYCFRVIEIKLKIMFNYLSSLNLLTDVLILIFVFIVLIYLTIRANIGYKVDKYTLATCALITFASAFTFYLVVNQSMSTIRKISDLNRTLPFLELSPYKLQLTESDLLNSNKEMTPNKQPKIKSCQKPKLKLIAKKKDTCRKKDSDVHTEINTELSFGEFFAFITRVFVITVCSLIAIYVTTRAFLWVVLELPDDRHSVQAQTSNEKITLADTKTHTLAVSAEETKIKRQNYVKNISMSRASLDRFSIVNKIKRKHFDTAKTHSYSVDELSKNLHRTKSYSTNSLTSLQSDNSGETISTLQCYNFSTMSTLADDITCGSKENLKSNSALMSMLFNWMALHRMGSELSTSKIFLDSLNEVAQQQVSGFFL